MLCCAVLCCACAVTFDALAWSNAAYACDFLYIVAVAVAVAVSPWYYAVDDVAVAWSALLCSAPVPLLLVVHDCLPIPDYGSVGA